MLTQNIFRVNFGTFEVIAVKHYLGVVSVHRAIRNDRFTCAPCQGGAFQWVQAPPGNRSSRKQPEQSWR